MALRILAVLAVVAALGAATWYFWPADPPPPPAGQAPAPALPAAPEGPRHPIAAEPDPELPALKESDPAMIEALARLVGSGALQKFFDLEGLVHGFVATVDNLPREEYAQRLNPVKPFGGPFQVTGSGESAAIAPANAARYAAFVGMVEAIDTATAVGLYRRFYPLFQQAYVDLGYPGGYFNDRLVQVIDHLLATPDIEGPLALKQPHVLYEYADPELERRSSGQKALIRIGRENAQRLKAKLSEVRAHLVAAEPKR